jgi:hypothetical protein
VEKIETLWCKLSNLATTDVHSLLPTTSPPPSPLMHNVPGQQLQESRRKLPQVPTEYQAADGGDHTAICTGPQDRVMLMASPVVNTL